MRVAISQRADVVGPHAERRDALDQRWASVLEGLGLAAVPVPNALQNVAQWARMVGIQAVLLSGGNDVAQAGAAVGQHAPERHHTESALLAMAREQSWPVLGVCRGLQMLNHHLGGGLLPVSGHVASRHGIWRCAPPVGVLACMPVHLEVNSFHHWGLHPADLAPEMDAVMCDADGHVEAAQHRQLPWAGIMWHPERESALADFDRSLLLSVFHRP